MRKSDTYRVLTDIGIDIHTLEGMQMRWCDNAQRWRQRAATAGRRSARRPGGWRPGRSEARALAPTRQVSAQDPPRGHTCEPEEATAQGVSPALPATKNPEPTQCPWTGCLHCSLPATKRGNRKTTSDTQLSEHSRLRKGTCTRLSNAHARVTG